MICTLAAILMIVFAYIIGRQVVIPAIALFVCATLIFSDVKDATCIILVLTSFSGIFLYRATTFYIYIIAVYIMVVVFKGRFVKSLIFMAALLAYSILLANPNIAFKVGSLTSVVYLVLVIFICDNIDRKDMGTAVDCYIDGFALSTLLGLFKKQIPALDNALKNITLIIDGDLVDQNRFCGLFDDPNFFSAVNCTAISSILFANKKLTKRHILLLVFFIVVGFLTYSKSYILTLAVIMAVYVLKNGRHIFRSVMLLVGMIAILLTVEYILKVDILSLFLSRFETADDINDLTTGRWGLWLQYLEYIFDDITVLFFGDGFNSRTIYRASHNTFIEMLFRYGIIGCALWVSCFISSLMCVSRDEYGNKIETTTIMPLLVLCAVYMFLSAFNFGYFGINIAIVFFAMYMPTEEEKRCLS